VKKRVFKVAIVLVSIIFVISGIIFSRLFILPTRTITSSMAIAELSKNELIYRSNVIVRGKVITRIGCEWDEPDMAVENNQNGTISTYYIVKVFEAYKGGEIITENVVVGVDGGQINRVVYKNLDSPEIKIGEEVILFLASVDRYPGITPSHMSNSYRILGYDQGKFALVDGGLYKNAFNNADSVIDLSIFSKELAYGINEYPLIRKPDLTAEEIAEINRQSMGE
jgi:hypothetical protein